MNRIYLLFTILIILCSCSKKHTENSTETITNKERIQSIKENFIETPFVSYRGIPLNCNTEFTDSILAKDTMNNELKHKCYLRKMKFYENNEKYLYEKVGFGISYYPRNESVMRSVRDLQKTLKKEAPECKTILDNYLNHCYSGELIVPIIENEDTIYKKIDGWFSYSSFKDSVYSVIFVTEFIKRHNNIEDTRDFENLTNSIIRMYDSKYGAHKQAENVYYTYWFNDKYIDRDFKYHTICNNNEFFDIIQSISWLIGQYEIQLCINNTFNDLYNKENKYEIIIRYINNDFVMRELDRYNELEKVYIEKENKERNEVQKQLEDELNQQFF